MMATRLQAPRLEEGSRLLTEELLGRLTPLLLVEVRLRFTAAVRLHFLHGGVIHGLLCQVLGHELPEGLIPFAPESGRVRFAAGDGYQFGLTATTQAAPRLAELGPKLTELGRRQGAGSGAPVTFGGNFAVEAVATLAEVDGEEVRRLAARLLERQREDGSVALHWLSPLRLERPPAMRAAGAGYVNGDCFPADLFLARLALRLGKLAAGAFPAASSLPPPPTEVQAEPRDLTWVDLPLTGRPEARPGRGSRMTLGGVLGAVRLSGLTAPWAEAVALGRFLHAGQSTRYGLGRYALAGVSPAEAEPFRPARTFLAEATAPAALTAALDHLAGETLERPDGDVESPLDDEALAALGAEVRAGHYQPPPLEGWLLPKEDGGLRPLAVPPLRDRALQRAAALALAPGIDTLLEDCSYAYRKGFSRAGAARAIQRAYDDGFRVVLDADIEAFFDSVDLDRLLAKLRALLPLEPLVTLVDSWMRAPVRFHGQLLDRRQGLPQGAPLSPLLANLYLDELDEEILGQGFRLVRFADDFVVLCRSVEEAEQAREVARQALADLGLKLHEGKTAIRHLDDGLTYLGYLFCRSLVLEEAEDEPTAPPPCPGSAASTTDRSRGRTPRRRGGWRRSRGSAAQPSSCRGPRSRGRRGRGCLRACCVGALSWPPFEGSGSLSQIPLGAGPWWAAGAHLRPAPPQGPWRASQTR